MFTSGGENILKQDNRGVVTALNHLTLWSHMFNHVEEWYLVFSPVHVTPKKLAGPILYIGPS